MKSMTLALIALAVCTPVAAQENARPPVLLLCQSDRDEDFSIELFRPTEWGAMHCVSGLLIADMTPCGPDGGWGLSAGTGLAPITEVTSNWQVAGAHYAGKFSAHLGPVEFRATAMHGQGIEPDLSDDSYDMTITLNRLTGLGSYASGALGEVPFDCVVAERKF